MALDRFILQYFQTPSPPYLVGEIKNILEFNNPGYSLLTLIMSSILCR